MRITGLTVDDFRILHEVSLEGTPGLNVVTGDNGAGKTSILEAIYVAGRGESFRHREVRPWIRDGAERARIVVTTVGAAGQEHRIGIEQGRGGKVVRVDGRDMKRRSELVRALPLQLVTPNSHELIEKGPGIRRRFLDWGLFHVEHEFSERSLRYRKCLQQRNRALRSGDGSYVAWEPMLAEEGERWHRYRQQLLPELGASVSDQLKALGQAYSLEFRLRSGWGAEEGYALSEVLRKQREADVNRGHTGAGPHRASIELLADGHPAERRLSRGQQKLLVYALFLALGALVKNKTGEGPVMLIDDIAAELDRHHRALVVACLREVGLQAWITALEWEAEFTEAHDNMFHVEHGLPRRGDPSHGV